MLLLKNAQVFSPVAMGLCHILIGGQKILWIGKELPTIDAMLAVEIVDLDGCLVLPGLIDGHTHITGGGGESGYSSRVPPVELSRYTKAGITTVVGVLGTDDTTRNTQTLVTQARGLCEEGITAYCYTGGYHVPLTTLTGSVREDIAYIDRIIGVGELAISDHRSSQPTYDEVLRIASDAHVGGLMTGKAGIVHFHLGNGSRGLELLDKALNETEIPARVFNPTHINRKKRLFDEAIQLANQGCYIDVTIFPETADDAWSAEEALLRYLNAGNPANRITLSTDGGGCLPEFDEQGQVCRIGVGDPMSFYSCLKNLLEQGQDLTKVLPAFTSNVAELLRLPAKGRVAVGADADLLVLQDNYEHWGTIALGEWHVKAGELLRQGQFETMI